MDLRVVQRNMKNDTGGEPYKYEICGLSSVDTILSVTWTRTLGFKTLNAADLLKGFEPRERAEKNSSS